MTSGEHTKGADLLALADRVEKLTGPDRELDALIWCVAFAPPDAYVKQSPINGAWCIYHGVSYHDPSRPNLWEAKNCRVLPVTASLDAAMTLVPKDHGWLVGNGRTRPDEPLGGAQIYSLDGKELVAESEAATPALAFTAACLRALAHSTSGESR